MDTYTIKYIIFILIINTLKLSAQNDTLLDSESILKDSYITDSINIQNIDYFDLGKKDAKKYYNKLAPFVCSGAVTGFSIPLGIVASLRVNERTFGVYFLWSLELSSIIFFQSRPLKLYSEYNPNNQFLNNNIEYYKGYRKEAKKRKIYVNILGFGYGLSVAIYALGMLIVVENFLGGG